MRKFGVFSAVFLVLYLLPVHVTGQTRETVRRPSGEGGSSRSMSNSGGWASRGNSPSDTSSAATRSSSTASVSPRRSSGGFASVGSSGGQGSGYSEAQQISNSMRQRYGYWPGYMFSPMNLYYMDLFYSRLWFRYGYMPAYDYLGVYAQGAPPLSLDAARLALRDSTDASSGLVQLSQRLQSVLSEYRQGQVSQQEFDGRVAEVLAGIRTYSKFIREDYSLMFLGPQQDGKVGSFSTAKSLDELQGLVDELQKTARQIESGISALNGGDGIRTVSLDSLSQPSFKTMSRRLEKLAKSIEKSVHSL